MPGKCALHVCDVPLASFVPQDINFEDKFRIVGQQLLTPSAPAGEPLTLLVAYRVEAPPDPTTSFFVHLVNPDGSVIGQADRTVQTGRYQVGDVFVRALRCDAAVERASRANINC